MLPNDVTLFSTDKPCEHNHERITRMREIRDYLERRLRDPFDRSPDILLTDIPF